MKKYPCPSCGANVTFVSSASVFAVCSYCKSTIVRQDMNLETLGKMADLPEDMSPFQIRTSGKYENRNFTLWGRLKVSWAEGNWNEWFAQFNDGKEGWLAEAQGFYMMSFEVPGAAIPPLSQLSVGKTLSLAGKEYEVSDIKTAVCEGSEGELPFRALKGRKSTSVDLDGPNDTFASIDYGEGEPPRLYVGKYLDFDDFYFTELRKFDGW